MSSRSRRSTERPAGRTPPRNQPSRSFHVESLGCAKNQVDSERMIAALEKAGWSLAEGPESAGVLIVNTCGFISDAKKQSIETSLELKARHPEKKVIMVGCLTERYGEEIGRELGEIDGFLGNRDPTAIVDVVEGRARPSPQLTFAADSQPYFRSHLLSFPGSAYVKVAEGCSNRCTYCAIPLIRGDLASRDRGEIVQEVRSLLDTGIRELVLIAQDLGSYGKDKGSPGLVRLLSDIAQLSGDFWVRLLYIHPDHFPEGLLDLLASDPRFLPYFDFPFQHAAPSILRAMGRRGEPAQNLQLISRVRARLPNAAIRSTFLVGFPGETEEDFKLLLDFQEEARLDWLGTFTYSREEDTPAYAMPGRVTKATARARKAEIERRQIPITERALDAHVGKTLDVLVEEPIEGEELSLGRAYLQAPDVDGLVVVHPQLAAGTMVPVRITRRNGVDLEGEALHGGA
jgi:ribosomal protein S12 methylthiotransferase